MTLFMNKKSVQNVKFIFLIDWDYIVVDEAHEGTQTSLGQKVLEAVLEGSSSSKKPKLLEL